MGLRSLIAVVSLMSVSALAAAGCSKSAQKVQPETRGKRGETCLARNDCDTGLACINGICSQNEFNVDVKAKQCTRTECDTDKDCCGTKLTSAPAKCRSREETCNQPTLPGCTVTSCTSDATCSGGAPCLGVCTGIGQTNTACSDVSECAKVTNTCVLAQGSVDGYCSATQTLCGETYGVCAAVTASCTNKSCHCQNPTYNPAAEICSDPDCEDICLLRCQDNLCLEDKSCKTDAQCLALGLQICDAGRCVECTEDTDCDVKGDETCVKGQCKKPCTQNEECGLFEECDTKKGDCVYVGCQSDRECILAASRPVAQNPEAAAAVSGGADDPRLYKCLATEGSKYKTCKIPCENDGSCGQFQVCDAGYCKFIGCDNDEECRAYLGISNQVKTDAKPYVPSAKCVAITAAPETP